MRDEVTTELIQRGRAALYLGAVVLIVLTMTYYLLGCVIGMNARHDKSLFSFEDDRWQLSECVYAAAITVTAVGYTDLLGTERCEIWVDGEGRRRWVSNTDPHEDDGFDEATALLETDWSFWTRAVTAMQVVMGMAFFLYVIAQVTTFFRERGHAHLMTTLRTRRQLKRLEEHVVVCGIGRAARRAVEKLQENGITCAVVDDDAEELSRYRLEQPGVPCLVGDATEEDTLEGVRLGTARALLALMPDDAKNLVTLFSARTLAPELHVVCRGMRSSSVRRLSAAGADTVIGIEALAGLRAASELIRPTVVDFLDLMMRGEGEGDVHFAGLKARVDGDSIALRDLALREHAGIHAVAVRRADEEEFQYNPGRSEEIRDGDEIVFLGTPQQVERARDALHAGRGLSVDGSAEPMTMEIAMDVLQPPDSHATVQRRDHFIVCGAGLVGIPIVRELLASGRRAVLIDLEPDQATQLGLELSPSALVRGDALDPDVLHEAGIEHARGLVTALPYDRSNLVVVVTALQLHPGLRTVAVAREHGDAERLTRAGANVISLDRIAGHRMAADVLRPHATTFLDRMRAAGGGTRFEGVLVTQDGGAVGYTIADLRIFDRTGMRVLALRRAGERGFAVNPPGDLVLEAGTVLIAVGEPMQVQALERIVGRTE
jgi:voltage-gated potassium channel